MHILHHCRLRRRVLVVFRGCLWRSGSPTRGFASILQVCPQSPQQNVVTPKRA
jgi:hypothetical protein